MSHFTVMVIGEEIEKQLAPFQENNMGDCPQEYMKYRVWSGGDDQWFDSEETAKTALGDKFDEDDAYWENPNKKWDWYQVGGRWNGFFTLKPNGAGELGEPSLLMLSEGYTGAPANSADSALKKDIDFAGMRDKAGGDAAEKWDKAHAMIGNTLETFIPWEKMRDEVHQGDIEAARAAYHQQAANQALRVDENLRWANVEDFMVSRETYVQQARDTAVITFAVLKDGKWYERGEMGWWACVSNEKGKDEWSKEVSALLDSLPDDTRLTVVDCHI